MLLKKILRTINTNPKVQYWLFTIGLALPCFFMAYTEPHPWYVRVLQIFFGLGLFSSLMCVKRRPGRGLYFCFIFVFFGTFQLALLYLYGNSPIAVDMFLNALATNANEAGELLGNIIVGVILACGFYISLLLIAVQSFLRRVAMDKQWRRMIRRRVALPLLVVSTSAATLLQAFTHFNIVSDLYPVNVSYNICVAVARYYKLMMYNHTSAQFTFQSQPSHDAAEQETYLFIIGETARSINWGLYGYERQTTPRLSAREGLITYTDVLSQSNTTHKSVPLLMTTAEAADASPMYEQHSILQAFREAGFYTMYISNQANNGSLIDHYSQEADTCCYVREQGQTPDDAHLLSSLRGILAHDKHAKRLILIHCYGSHFKYCDRVPDAYRVFRPCEDKQLEAKNREDLLNAFDNVMLYTDMIVDSLMTITATMPADTLQPYNFMALYTADHGEDIYDDERHNFLHASPIVSFYQMAVPFVMWCNDGYRQNHSDRYECLVSHRSEPIGPGREVFHTLMGAAGISSPYFQEDHDLSSPLFKKGERLYLNDHNDPTPLHRLHLIENDFQQMKMRGMQTE